MTIDDYKNWYTEHYGEKPSEKLIESFCRTNGVPLPQHKVVEESPYIVPRKVEVAFGKEVG